MKNILIKESYDEISAWCDDMEISGYSINSDGSINAPNGVNLREVGIHDLPFKFNEVSGIFEVSKNHLITLEKAPEKVFGAFYICDNELYDIRGFPKYIKGNVDISGNTQITSLYVGDYDVIIEGDIYIEDLDLPRQLTNFIHDHGGNDSDNLRIIFKYQRHFEIWNNDRNNSLNVENFNELINEIKDGLQ